VKAKRPVGKGALNAEGSHLLHGGEGLVQHLKGMAVIHILHVPNPFGWVMSDRFHAMPHAVHVHCVRLNLAQSLKYGRGLSERQATVDTIPFWSPHLPADTYRGDAWHGIEIMISIKHDDSLTCTHNVGINMLTWRVRPEKRKAEAQESVNIWMQEDRIELIYEHKLVDEELGPELFAHQPHRDFVGRMKIRVSQLSEDDVNLVRAQK
jgi:hypothetical protein